MRRSQSQQIIEKILTLSKADTTEVFVSGGAGYDLRFAVNTITTCGSASSVTAYVNAAYGSKRGSVSTTDLSDEGLEFAVRTAESLAELAPENPEFMPPLGKETKYSDPKGFDEETSQPSPANMAHLADECLKQSGSGEIDLSGFLSVGSNFMALGSTSGLFAFHEATNASFSTTARTTEGRGSSKVQSASFRLRDINPASMAQRAIERALAARNPEEIPPGRYPTILEPSATADMLGNFARALNRRSADEGRSFFSEPGGNTKLGQQLFPKFVNLVSDPQHVEVPVYPWGYETLPHTRTVWVEDGIIRNMTVERYWAKKHNLQALPPPGNLIMEGSQESLEDLIASTERGILVTNLWYIREVDPQKLLLTGLTRDGLFLIENGKVTRPLKNFRFNESPVEVLRNVEKLGRPQRAVGNEVEGIGLFMPALKLSSFNFSTVSDAI